MEMGPRVLNKQKNKPNKRKKREEGFYLLAHLFHLKVNNSLFMYPLDLTLMDWVILDLFLVILI